MKYGLFAAIVFAFAMVGGTASAGVATSGLTKSTVVPAMSIVEKVGRHSCRRCTRRCRRHHGWFYCKRRCWRRCH